MAPPRWGDAPPPPRPSRPGLEVPSAAPAEHAAAVPAAARAPLQQHGLPLEDGKRLLEALYFSLAAGLPLAVGLRLGRADLQQVLVVIEDGGQFRLHAIPVRSGLYHACIQLLVLFGLIFDRLLLRRLFNLILPPLAFVVDLRRGLCGTHLGKSLSEVALYDLQEPDDASAGTLGCAVGLPLLGIVLTEDFQCHLHTLQARLHLRLVPIELLFLLLPQPGEFCLRARQLGQSPLKRGHLFLELSG
mmetsp:Transcript_26378/g.83604  ORF Transcript_26378/g.83604 Transcript_26378/m.83604 type:complete len:245 (-) Transcript_26378:623-1357(-)